MKLFGHILTAAVIAIVLRWLWNSSALEQSKFESGRQLFPPTRAIRMLIMVGGVMFTALFVWARVSPHRPDEWWVAYMFLVFVALFVFMYPPVLSIEVDGIGSRSWFGGEKKIPWQDVASLNFNTGNRQFTVRANDGRKISHAGFNVDPSRFQSEIHSRTRLPLKITKPGTWKSETIEVPYEEEVEEESSTSVE